jgi:signal peptidase I
MMAAARSWGKSKVMEGTLDPFVVQQNFTVRNYRILGKEMEPTPQPNEYVTFVSHLEHGFGTPSSLFF